MSVSEDLMGVTNARVWARRFVAEVRRDPTIATSQMTMLAWFALAIEAGRDAGLAEHGSAHSVRSSGED